jgi:AcrR family transcriptional regulator
MGSGGVCLQRRETFEARLETRDRKCIWSIRELEDAKLSRVAAFLEEGMSLSEIANAVGVSKATA